jgi:SAM-dependent methyltransferase
LTSRTVDPARAWTEALAAWAIPEEILSSAPESPWTFPVELFASRADQSRDAVTPSVTAALEALPSGGIVLDVGCGAGAASLPLASTASKLVGMDTSPDMLTAFGDRAADLGVAFEAIEGRWPDDADRAPVADVVVCNHVAYNAPDLAAFATALTDHARHRVVLELTAHHPQSSLNPLWLRFHGLERPTRPTADDAVAVLRHEGFDPERRDWEAPAAGGFVERASLVAWIRRRLCLPADRDPEVEEAIAPGIVQGPDGTYGFEARDLVTLWWDRGTPTAARRRSAPAASGG